MLSKWSRVQITEVVPQLAALPQPVIELYTEGPLKALLQRPRVAIVGSRKVTSYGRMVTERFARELTQAGVVIISGLALGVDSIAHQACLDAGGQTIAVLPAGLDRIYPAQHHNLSQAIVRQGGALVSEYAPSSWPPQKFQFIARNRIIASLSQVVIIAEAAERSGSLHTAQFALEQGIDVCAVPGNITNPSSSGSNKLIQIGALPLLSTEDVLHILGITSPAPTHFHPTTSAEKQIIQALHGSTLSVSELLRHTNLNLPHIQQTLTMLEIQGAITQTNSGQWMTTH